MAGVGAEGFCSETAEQFSRGYLCLDSQPWAHSVKQQFSSKRISDFSKSSPWNRLVLSAPIGYSHMYRNLLNSLDEGWAWVGSKDWFLAPGPFLLVGCCDLLHLRSQNDPTSISQSDWQKRCHIVKYYSHLKVAEGLFFSKSPLAGSDLPGGQSTEESPLLEVLPFCMSWCLFILFKGKLK